MSHICNYQHIVFRTKHSRQTIPDLAKLMLIKYIHKICCEHGIVVKSCNAHRNHVHVLLSMPATIGIEEIVTLIKTNTSKAFNRHRLFPFFDGWGAKYGAFSVSYSQIDKVIKYIESQEMHHEGRTFYDEFRALVEMNGGKINQYFEKDFGAEDCEADPLME